ncbi:hypothetical protein P153DRAFT_12504 [Dothidotthia symphoricarpi CBS 119687]|uniref:Uncharacterized protein n=1 Tax=Dothidotthia symphoricarpi CBS 119687 TaxID=1392245 RepID=A0A6A6AVC4_9PLEO|nr:uncharacterized protein P153DRAFT_12504 [Dothidotthia symphoricarpi CBS 119687]KAF2134915.1 hypothetical protein P153DRAFT_12504 [Dothidotthia symphoricarpi CBS 119687]
MGQNTLERRVDMTSRIHARLTIELRSASATHVRPRLGECDGTVIYTSALLSYLATSVYSSVECNQWMRTMSETDSLVISVMCWSEPLRSCCDITIVKLLNFIFALRTTSEQRCIPIPDRLDAYYIGAINVTCAADFSVHSYYKSDEDQF